MTTTHPPTQTLPFVYLLNAFERASQSEQPGALDYGAKRRALLDYVVQLEAAVARRSPEGAEREATAGAGVDQEGSTASTDDAQDVPVRVCCHCRKPIDGVAYTSGGVYWHPYGCLATMTCDEVVRL